MRIENDECLAPKIHRYWQAVTSNGMVRCQWYLPSITTTNYQCQTELKNLANEGLIFGTDGGCQKFCVCRTSFPSRFQCTNHVGKSFLPGRFDRLSPRIR